MRQALAIATGMLGLLAAAPGQAQQPATQQPPNREFTLANETDQILREFYASPAGQADRAGDRLGADTVAPGATYRIRLGRTRDCLWDLRAVLQDGTAEERRRVDICRSQRVTFGDPSLPWREAEVANASRSVIREFYAVAPPAGEAAPRAADAWGPDRLGADVLPAGESFRLRLRARDCRFDLRAVYEDDREELRPGHDLCAEPRIAFDRSTIPRPPARRVTLVNRHLATVQEVYLSGSEENDWGPDRLGANLLPVGGETEVEMEGECSADLRIVYPNGGAEERREVDVCENPRIVLRPGWVVAERLEEEGPVGAAAEAPAAPATAAPEGLRLRNAGPMPVVEIYTPRPGSAQPGEDRLGASVLGVGEVLELLPPEPGACAADLIAIFRDGREIRRPGLDLCTGEEIEIP